MNRFHRVAAPAASALAALAVLVSHGSAAQADASVSGLFLSAPIVPNTTVIYPAEGASFPTSLSAEAALASSAAITYDALLAACPTLTSTSGDPYDIDTVTASPSVARLQLNYDSIARCAYEHYTAKPYWIPALVDDVDICASSLGAAWHLPSEAEILALGADDLSALAGAYDPLAPTFSGFGGMYFSMKMYVRGSVPDGSGHFPLKVANLAPSAAIPMDELRDGVGDVMGPSSPNYKVHNEAAVVLRCVTGTL